VVELKDKGDLGVVSSQWHVKNQRNEDVAICLIKVAVSKKPKG
jgi:acyl dehydratase